MDGTPDQVVAHIRAMADAGAAEVQLVVDPITQGSIELLGEALRILDAG